jgi:hypothetical protein
MAYYIFLKSLRSLEEFRKNPHVKIPPKSPCANFQSLGKFKNPIFNSKIYFLRFRPGRPCGPLDLWPSQPAPAGLAVPTGQNLPHRPIQPVRRWRLYGSTFSLLVRALRDGRFSLVSLSSGPRLSALSLTSGRLSSTAPPPPLGHPAPPSSAPRVPPSRYHPAIIPPLNSPLNPPSSMALKSLMPVLTPATPPRPYKNHPDDPRSTSQLTEPFSSPLPHRNPSPPSFCDLFVPPPSPGRHATA